MDFDNFTVTVAEVVVGAIAATTQQAVASLIGRVVPDWEGDALTPGTVWEEGALTPGTVWESV